MVPANTRYLILGAAHNGDGTTLAEAASAGAAGAWNQEAILTTGATPTYGTLPADTVVHIRSKTGNGADADITFTLAANGTWGNANATVAAPIIFVFDDGTVWSGVNGTVLVESVSSSYTLTLRTGTILMHRSNSDTKLVFENRHAACNNVTLVSLGIGSQLCNAFFDFSKVTHTSNGPRALAGPSSGGAYGDNIKIKVGARAAISLVLAAAYGSVTINGLDIELTTVSSFGTSNGFVFALGSNGSRLVVNGGRIHGAGATATTRVFNYNPGSDAGGYIFTGFSWPYDMQTHGTISVPAGFDCRIEALGCDGVSGSPRQMGAIKVQRAGAVDSRNDGNHPYLNASFNDSVATGWSWRVVPERGNSNNVLDVKCFKVFSGVAAIKTISIEAQVRTSFLRVNGGVVDKGSTWINVSYIDDTTGAVVTLSTLDPTSVADLDSSSAAWSATTWGAIALTKKKLTITTPTTVKQDTLIGVTFNTSALGSSASDVIFVCPDPLVVDV